ncbi:hypothetical protein [Scopulibacillus cellulosilyticus]|uniref:Uncharacterized protein n=1 Tax=Scopulibacillus cellulosilyticus TaxID=2665665 RepID=A0ABW2Q125_9BACL
MGQDKGKTQMPKAGPVQPSQATSQTPATSAVNTQASMTQKQPKGTAKK